jgi:glyoxylase-like metal-dependent hydrolase (beta-lactamase superfamily II)
MKIPLAREWGRVAAVAFAAVVPAGAGGAALNTLDAQQDMSDVEITTVRLENDLFVLLGRGGNIGLSVGEDGAFLIDDQFAPLTEKILAAVAEVTDQPVRWVLNTHWHGDHTGGNENLGREGALIVAHENVYRRLNPAEFDDLVGRSQQVAPEGLPVVTFNDRVAFHWNGEDIRVNHMPNAHTDGDALVFFTNADAVHMGDTFFNGRYPFIDVDSGGNVDGVIAIADYVLEHSTGATSIIPGHGEITGRTSLQAYRDMLSTVRARVSGMIDDGMTEDEVVAAAPTSDLDATWGENPERFVRGVYISLAGS